MRQFGLMILLMIALMGSGCVNYQTIQPGHAGIEVKLNGTNQGVQEFAAKTGRIWYNPWNTSILQYPTFTQTVQWTANKNEGRPTDESITFTAMGGIVVNADVSASYQIGFDSVPKFYVQFRSDDLDQFTHGFFKNVVRDAFNETAGKYSIEQIMGDNAEFIHAARNLVEANLKPLGISISQFGFIGAPRPPQNVIESINQKIQATQNAIQTENEVRQTKAQAEKNVAAAEGEARAAVTRAEGQAKANQIKAASITPQILEWERLAATREAIGRWNGQPSQFVGGGSGNPTSFLFQMPQANK